MRNRALIVVQDQSLHQEIVDSLQTTALEIDCAETYAQAISLYARFHYVLVILDLGILSWRSLPLVPGKKKSVR